MALNRLTKRRIPDALTKDKDTVDFMQAIIDQQAAVAASTVDVPVGAVIVRTVVSGVHDDLSVSNLDADGTIVGDSFIRMTGQTLLRADYPEYFTAVSAPDDVNSIVLGTSASSYLRVR